MKKVCVNSLHLFFVMSLIAPNGFAAQSVGLTSENSQEPLPKSCMRDLWRGLLPFVAKDSYIIASDIERLAGIKMQKVVDVAPGDTMATYEDNGPTPLSVRVEVLNTPLSYTISHMKYTWQVLQGRSMAWHGSTSVVDFACIDSSGGLQLAKVEADLSSLGFHKIGSTAEVHAEYFLGRAGSVVIYFDVPVESVSTVSSLHIVGSRSELARSSSAH